MISIEFIPNGIKIANIVQELAIYNGNWLKLVVARKNIFNFVNILPYCSTACDSTLSFY